MADAEAIAEAGLGATLLLLRVKSWPQQQRAVLFRSRELLVKQRPDWAQGDYQIG